MTPSWPYTTSHRTFAVFQNSHNILWGKQGRACYPKRMSQYLEFPGKLEKPPHFVQFAWSTYLSKQFHWEPCEFNWVRKKTPSSLIVNGICVENVFSNSIFLEVLKSANTNVDKSQESAPFWKVQSTCNFGARLTEKKDGFCRGQPYIEHVAWRWISKWSISLQGHESSTGRKLPF